MTDGASDFHEQMASLTDRGGAAEDGRRQEPLSCADARIARGCFWILLTPQLSAMTILGHGRRGSPTTEYPRRHDDCERHPALQCAEIHVCVSFKNEEDMNDECARSDK